MKVIATLGGVIAALVCGFLVAWIFWPRVPPIIRPDTDIADRISAVDDSFHVVGVKDHPLPVLANDRILGDLPRSIQIVSTGLSIRGSTIRIGDNGNQILFRPRYGVEGDDTFSYTITAKSAKNRQTSTANVRVRIKRQLDVDKQKSCVVWLGLESGGVDGTVHTGWALDRLTIVSTALTVSILEFFEENDDYDAIVGHNDLTYQVASFHVHPRYAFGAPGDATSLQHNVGIIKLETALPADVVYPKLGSIDFDELEEGAKFVAIGFWNPLKIEEPFDKVRVRIVSETVTVVGSELAEKGSPALIKVKTQIQKGLDGCPVFDNVGDVVGTLTLTELGPRVAIVSLLNSIRH